MCTVKYRTIVPYRTSSSSHFMKRKVHSHTVLLILIMTSSKRSLEETSIVNDDKKRKLILELPLSDFPSTSTVAKRNNDDDDDNTLFLLQLPSTIDRQSYSSSNIVITDTKDKKTNCRWITSNETRHLIRVESSNAYVLVPPKEQKARLLRETDTYFLTTTDKCNQLPTLEEVSQLLPATMETLVETFATSPKQLEQVLQQLPYIVKQEDGFFSMCCPTNIQECNNSIVSTLLEECHDLTSTLSTSSLLPQIKKRMCDTQQNSIILYTLHHLSTDNNTKIPILQKDVKDDHNETIQLDITKVRFLLILFTQKLSCVKNNICF